MKRRMHVLALWERSCALLVLASLSGCMHYEWELHSANDSGVAAEVLVARLTSYYPGVEGTIELTMPDGEVLKGQWRRDSSGGAGYGSIYDAVYGAQGASGKSSVHKGAATLQGDRSTSMQCEFYTRVFSGRVTGACRASDGSLYRFER